MKLFYYTLAIFSFQFLFGQLSPERLEKLLSSGSVKELIEANTEQMIQGSHYHAMLLANKLVEMEPDNANFNYRKGRSMLAMGNTPESIMPFFLKGASEVNRTYDAISPKEKSAPTDALYWLALCYHQTMDLDNAEANYQKYLDNEVYKSVELRKYALNGLQQVANARKEKAAPKNFVVKNAGPMVNGKNPDYASYISLDGTSMYFTSRRLWSNEANAQVLDPRVNLHREAIFLSIKQKDGSWGTPKLMDFCVPEFNYASVSVSKDERVIYSYNDRVGGGDIYLSNLVDGEFKTYEKLMTPRVNTPAWEPHYVLSNDGKTIYFVSDRKGGLGGRDIWKLTQLANGEWSRDPINLGPEVNSPFDEDAPFIALDNKTLFFSSNGPKSTGGFDVLKTMMNADGTFAPAENMGYPINSTTDDLYFTTTGSGEYGYFTSYRKGGLGEKDIYEVTMTSQKIEQVAMLRAVVQTKDGSPIPSDISSKLICSNCTETGETEILTRLRDGVIISPLEKGKNYELVYMQSGTKLHEEKFKTNTDNKFQLVELMYIIGVGPVTKNYYINGKVTDSKSNAPIEGVAVELVALSGNKQNKSFTTNPDGKFEAKVLEGYIYGTEVTGTFTLKKDGYIVQTVDKTFKLGVEAAVALNFSFVADQPGPVPPGPLALGIIYYDLNKWEIRDDAQEELNKIIRLMNENPEMVIELTSHTDCRSSAAYNLTLSQKRAQAAVTYIRKGLKSNPNRITGKGVGESELKNNCKCECEQSTSAIGTKKFRECEDEQAKNCTTEQHQENRRTEFKIVSNEKKSPKPNTEIKAVKQ